MLIILIIIVLTFFNVIFNWGFHKPPKEDIVDRLVNNFVSYILISLGLLIYFKFYFNSRIFCYENEGNFQFSIEPAQEYCFTEGTHFVPANESLVGYEELHKYKKLDFYQWAPEIVAIIGFLFLIPTTFWNYICWDSYINVDEILEEGKKVKDIDTPPKESLKPIISHMFIVLNRKHEMKRTTLMTNFWFNNFNAHYLTSSYLTMKILNILFLFFTLLWIPKIIAHEDSDFLGFKTIADLVSNWQETELFPRVTSCSFKFREAENGNIVLKSKLVHCILSGNRLIKPAYSFIWFGLMLLLIVYVVNIIRWAYLLTPYNRRNYLYNVLRNSMELAQPKIGWQQKFREKFIHALHNIENKLRHLENVQKNGHPIELETAQRHYQEAIDKVEVIKFQEMTKCLRKRKAFLLNIDNYIYLFEDFCGVDGFLTIRLLHANAGSVIANTVISGLFWKFFKQEEEKEGETQALTTFV